MKKNHFSPRTANISLRHSLGPDTSLLYIRKNLLSNVRHYLNCPAYLDLSGKIVVPYVVRGWLVGEEIVIQRNHTRIRQLKSSLGMCPTLMKHLTLNQRFLRVLDSYTIGMGCVLNVVRGDQRQVDHQVGHIASPHRHQARIYSTVNIGQQYLKSCVLVENISTHQIQPVFTTLAQALLAASNENLTSLMVGCGQPGNARDPFLDVLV